MQVFDLIKKIQRTNSDIKKAAQEKIDFKTKPLGSLGMLETIAVKMASIQNNLNPKIKNKSIFVFAGDHGIAEEGVSAYPSEVTGQMILNFLNKGAAINVLCSHNNIDLKVIDMGVNYDFKEPKGLINKKIAHGTGNFLKKQAMTEEQAIGSIQNGIDVFNEFYNKNKINIIGAGDMGIGNTTSSSAVISVITGISPDKTTGRGTGIDDKKFFQKIRIIEQALKMHKPKKDNAVDILQKIGGFEIGGITGAVLAASYHKIPVVIDGIISTAGALLAFLLNPDSADYIFAGHKSVEVGHRIALDYMGLKPILDLDMRLGEGTGAALAMNIIEASCRIMTDMTSFEEAGVSRKE